MAKRKTFTATTGPAPTPASGDDEPKGVLREAGKAVRAVVSDPVVQEIVGSQARALLSRSLLGSSFAGAVAVRVATRSVPGAILVGSVVAAKYLHDRRKARKRAERLAEAESAAETDGSKPAKSG